MKSFPALRLAAARRATAARADEPVGRETVGNRLGSRVESGG